MGYKTNTYLPAFCAACGASGTLVPMNLKTINDGDWEITVDYSGSGDREGYSDVTACTCTACSKSHIIQPVATPEAKSLDLSLVASWVDGCKKEGKKEAAADLKENFKEMRRHHGEASADEFKRVMLVWINE